VSCPQRDTTTVAPQALWSLNNASVYRQARELAARVVKEGGSDPNGWVQRLWMIALARPINDDERRDAIELLDRLSSSTNGQGDDREIRETQGQIPENLAALPPQKAAALMHLCLAVYNLNEFAFVD